MIESHFPDGPEAEPLAPQAGFLPACALLHDIHGRIVQANGAVRDVFRRDPAGLIGANMQVLLPGEVTAEPRFCTEIERIRREGALSYEHVGLRGDGTQFVFRATTAVVPAEQGRPRLYCTTIQDVTAQRRTERILQRREAILEAVGYTAERLLSAADWREGTGEIVSRLGRAAEASRAYLLENYAAPDGDLRARQLVEWVAPGIRATIDDPALQELSFRDSGLKMLADLLSRGQVFSASREDAGQALRRSLEIHDIVSLVCVPVFVRGQWWGYVGFDECSAPRRWAAAEIEALRMAARALGAAIERERTRRALRESEARLRALMGALPDRVTLMQRDGEILELCSPGSFPSRPVPDEVGRNYYQAAQPWQAERVRACAEEAFRTGRTQRFEYDIEIDGSICFRELNIVPIGADRMLMIIRDATEQRRAEQALAESERKYRHLFTNAQAGLFRTRISDGRLLECNDAFARMFGFEGREHALASARAGDFYAEPDERQRTIERMRRHGAVADQETRFVRRDGRPLWMRYSARVYPDQDMIEGVGIDVTEEHAAREALAEGQRRYRDLFNNAQVGLYRSRIEDGRILAANDRIIELLGFASREAFDAEPRSGNDFCVDATDRDDMVRRIRERGEVRGFHVRIRRADGETRWVSLTAKLRSVEGCIEGAAVDITEQKNAEDSLRQSEHLYRLLAENATDFIFTMSMELEFTYASPAGQGMFGYAPEEIEGQPLSRLVAASSVPTVLGVVQEELRRENDPSFPRRRHRTVEVDLLRRDGSVFRSEVSARFLRDEQERPVGIVGVARDITERRAAEEALRESEQRYRTVVEAADEAIFTMNREGRFLFLNGTAAARLGGTPEQFVGKTMSDVFPPQNATAQLQTVQQVIDSGEPSLRETLTAPGGRLRWYRTSVQPLRGADGAVHSVLAIASDITTIKEAQEVLRRTAEELEAEVQRRTAELAAANRKLQRELTARKRVENARRESERRYRLLVENATDMIYTLDTEGGLTYVSPRLQAVTGFRGEELLGRNASAFICPRDHALTRRGFDARIRGEDVPPYEFRLLARDGTLIPVEIAGSAMYDDQGRVAGVQAILRDLRERKRAEQALRDSEAQLREILHVSRDVIYRRNLRTGELDYISPAVEQVTGYPAEQLAHRQFEQVVEMFHPDDRGQFHEIAARQREGTVTEDMLHDVEFRLLHRDGHYIWLSDRRALIRDADGRPVALIGALRDVTAGKQAEQALRARESLYRAVFENAPVPMIVYDSELVIRDVNRALAQSPTFATPREKVIGFDLRRARDKRPLKALRRALAGETIVDEGMYRATHSRARFPYRSIMSPIQLPDGKPGVLAIIQDISEELRHHRELQEVAERAVAALETERARIGRELHDELGQNLTALKMDAAWMNLQAAEREPELAARARAMGQLVDWTIGMARRMASDLRPLALDDLGLVEAIQWLAEQVAGRAGIHSTVSLEPEGLQVSLAVGSTAYRIVQEALTNVVRHADARNVQILLTLGNQRLKILVEDDGHGWPKEGGPTEGIGLKAMRERASLLGGTLEVEQSESGGFRIRATLPATESFDEE